MRSSAFGVALCLAFPFMSPALANDSEAETALGGLTLKHSDKISMDSEDLFISRDRVRVKYRFTNSSDAPIEALVAFVLPDIPPAQEEESGNWPDPARLNFMTTVEGRRVAFEIVEQAAFKGVDVSARLRAMRIPLNRLSDAFAASIDSLAKPDRDKLLADGLLRDDGGGDQHVWSALWSLRLNVTRRQTFPAKATISVEHEYAPLAGGSVGGGLSAGQRDSKWFKEQQRKYCIDREWLESFDRLSKKARRYSEIWLGYVLKTGANWNGPIKDFRLVVDKGKKDSLVSFCAEGVRKISPTQFEVWHKDFTPDRDLDVLIVDWSR